MKKILFSLIITLQSFAVGNSAHAGADPLASQVFGSLALGCVVANMMAQNLPSEAIMYKKLFVKPKTVPAPLQAMVNKMPGKGKYVIASKKYPQNLFIAINDSGLCNMFLANIWSADIPNALNTFYTEKNWQALDAKDTATHIQKSYKLDSEKITSIYSYKKGLSDQTIGLNLFVTFQTE